MVVCVIKVVVWVISVGIESTFAGGATSVCVIHFVAACGLCSFARFVFSSSSLSTQFCVVFEFILWFRVQQTPWYFGGLFCFVTSLF